MDLAKIIDELKTELDCLKSAIASMEQLARVQNTLNDGKGLSIPEGGQGTLDGTVTGKRRRGRPRKSELPRNQQATSANVAEPQENDVLTASSAA